MAAFKDLVRMLMEKKQAGQLAGIGKYGPQYNPGPTREFVPGPMAPVPFMPPAQVGPQTINLGLSGDPTKSPNNMADWSQAQRDPNNMPGYAPVPGQSPTFNQAPGTQAGAAAPKMRPFNAQAALAGLQLLQRARSEPMQWINMPVSRWGNG
jgi:hypothetical protein